MKQFKAGDSIATLEDLQGAVLQGMSFEGMVTFEHFRKGQLLHKETGLVRRYLQEQRHPGPCRYGCQTWLRQRLWRMSGCRL
jgi:hypothetical protein